MVREFLNKKKNHQIKRKAISPIAGPKRLHNKQRNYTTVDNDSEVIFSYKQIIKSKTIQCFKNYIALKKGASKVNKVKGICQFLGWTYYQSYKLNLELNEVEKWSYELIKHNSQLLYEYCHMYLKGALGNENSTVLIFIYLCVDPYIHWFTDIRNNCKKDFRINESTFGGMMRLSKSLKKEMSMQITKHKNNKTKQGMIENNRLPAGDANLILKKLCEDEYQIFKLIDQNSVNFTTYTNFMQAFSLGWWLVPQGRPKAIENLLNKDALLLLQNENIMESKLFKTQSSLGYQPIQGNPLLRY